MRIQYIADDGEVFDSREECLRYEESRNLRDVIMLDEEKGATDHPGLAWYAYLPNAQAYGAFKNVCEDEGAPAPERYELGCWLYDDDACEWRTFVEMEDKLSKRIIELEQLRGILTGESS